MLFPWIASLVAFIFLGVLSVIGILPSVFSVYLMVFTMLLTLPIFVPVINMIRTDMIAPHRFLTKPGILGLIVAFLIVLMGVILGGSSEYIALLCILWLGIYFSFESRWYFLGSFVLLLMLVITLLFGQNLLAEAMSVYVYYGLVLGVLVQIGSPAFFRIHRDAKPVIRVSSQFAHEYMQELISIFAILQHLAFLGIFGFAFAESRGWIRLTDQKILLTIVVSILFLFCAWVMFRRNPYSLKEFFFLSPNLWDQFVFYLDPVLQILIRILRQYFLVLIVAVLVVGIFGVNLSVWVRGGVFFAVFVGLCIVQRWLPVFFSYAKK